MTADDVRPFLAAHLPAFTATGPPEVLAGGYLNRVWRVPATPASVVVKHAPPLVGTLALDPSRVLFEADALRALAPDGVLSTVCSEHVRAPLLHTKNVENKALVMEDVGIVPSLDAWLMGAGLGQASTQGHRLGAFIGRLHTADAAPLRRSFTNLPIQQTRLDVQYRSIGPSLEAVGVTDCGATGTRAVALGTALLDPGQCLVMGDLWPRSVLVVPGGLRLIDWEMVHVGRPWQDTAHLAAHLWMLRQRRPERAASVSAFAQGFASGYASASPLRLSGVPEAAWHAGCEVIVRALGPFKSGYLYEGLAAGHAEVRSALETALGWLRSDEPVDLWGWARP